MSKLKEEQVRKWLRRIDLALEWRRPYENVWDRVIDYLKGKYFDSLDEQGKICVNMIRPHVNVVIPAVYSRNPDVMVLPRRKKQLTDDLVRKRAEIMQNLLRYYLKELGVKTEMKLCILDAIMTGHAWMKTGFETEFALEQAAKQDKKTVIRRFLESLGVEDGGEELEENDDNILDERIVRERPWVQRVSPYDIIVPTLSRRPEELPWITERSIVPYDYVMENDDYSTDGLKPSANAQQVLASLRGSKYKDIKFGDQEEFSILYEVWDGREKMVYTFAADHDKPLEEKKCEYTFLDSKYHNYVQLRFSEIIDEFFPQGDIEPAEPQILELNDIRTQMNNHRKRGNRIHISKPGAFDPQALADLKKGEDGTLVEHSLTYQETPLQDIVQPITYAPLSQDIYQVEARIKDDLFTILGTSDYASTAQRGARSATEASIIATQSRHKVEERIDAINGFAERIIRNLAMICQKYLDSEQVGAVIGDDAIYWLQMNSRKEIQGEFIYNVIYGSTTPINKEVDREQFMKFYMITRDDPYYDQVKLRLQLNRKFDLENPEEWLVSKIAEELSLQRMRAVKKGLLLGAPVNALGQGGEPGRVPSQGEGERLPTGQPQGLPGDLGGEPSVPGGTGGTNLA